MSQPQPARVAFDDVIIDVAGQRLWRGGARQPLEPKAFAVLVLLACSPGRVFGRDEILDAVWGHRHVTPGVLNRVVTLLRHALGEDAQAPRYLRTVHGVGYRFELPVVAETPPGASTEAPAPEAPAPDAAIAPAAHPLRRSSDAAPPPRKFPHAALWLLPLLAVLALAGWKLWPRHPATAAEAVPASEQRSIAVLPLVNASGDAAQQFFSDGISENLIDALSRFEGLKVIGRASSFRFRDGKDESKAIGARLGVAYLVSGSVQRAGDTVRIGVELVSTADGRTVWTEHYDRPYQDLFALQDDIARAIAAALQAKLLRTPGATKQDNRPPGGNMDAYNAYLQGLRNFYVGDYRKAIELQQKATQIEPDYAAAWAQLSTAWVLLGQYMGDDEKAQRAYAEARKATDVALRLAPDLGLAHGARGNLLLAADFDWRGSIDEFRRGAALAPENGQIRGGLSRALAASGHLHEAIEQRERFLSNEPLFAGNHFLYAYLLIASGRLDAAESSIRFGHELQPRPGVPFALMYVAILRGDANAAQDVAARQSPPWRELNLAVAAQIGPDRAAADAALATALKDEIWSKTTPYLIAQAYALRGDADKTVEWLERSWSRHDTNLHHLLYDPLILRFRNDPRLASFCAKVGLPPPTASEALSIDQIIAAANAGKR